ncbi:Uncharacterized protein dnm_016070 [Desulfonema magnum]|uniref:Uncharacterized protein n=1 Tax=Desulfonema magnum TaxID=45655 RepID=A0A975BHS2_9BACT|nr:Uncharacterized protein dnm_016070 [Desulfonema magnum]
MKFFITWVISQNETLAKASLDARQIRILSLQAGYVPTFSNFFIC